MDLEERTIEQVSERCEECGVRLTERELEAVMESGGRPLCTIHAQEVVPLEEAEGEGEEPPA